MPDLDLPALIEQAARAHVAHIDRRPDAWDALSPTAREYWLAETAITLPVIAAGLYVPIRELHPMVTVSRWRRDAVGDDHQDEERFCPACREDYPCPTVRALDAVEAAIRGES